MATSAELAAEVAARTAGARVQLVAVFEAYREDSGTTETIVWCSDGLPPDYPLTGSEVIISTGLELGQLGQSVTSTNDEGVASLIRGRTKPDDLTLSLTLPERPEVGGFWGESALVDGVITGLKVLSVSDLTPGKRIRRGDYFRLAGDHPTQWRVVLNDTAADGSGDIAGIEFFPPAGVATFADNTAIIGSERGGSHLSPWRAYAYAGHPFTGLYYVGNLASGERVAWADKGTLWSGGRVNSGHAAPESNVVNLVVRPPGAPWSRPIQDTLSGLAIAEMPSGWYRTTATARPYDPTGTAPLEDLWIRVTAHIGEPLRGTSTTLAILACGSSTVPDGGSYAVIFKPATLVFSLIVNIASSAYTVDSPVVSQLETGSVTAHFEWDTSARTLKSYFLEERDTARPRTVTAGTATTGLDVIGNYAAGAGQMTLYAEPTGTKPLGDMIIHELAVGSVLPTADAQREAFLRDPIDELEAEADFGLLAVYNGDIGLLPASGDVHFAHPLDKAATPTGPWEALIDTTDTATLAHSLEGGGFLAGTQAPTLLGWCQNVECPAVGAGQSATSDQFVYQVGAGPVVTTLIGGDEMPLDTGGSHSQREAFFTTAPASGKYTEVGGGSRRGFIRHPSAPIHPPISDCWGVSLFDRGLHFDGSATLVDFPLAVNQLFEAPASFSVWWYLEEDLSSGQTLYDSWSAGGEGFQVWYLAASGGGVLRTLWHTSAGSNSFDAEISKAAFFDRPNHVTVTFSEAAGTITARVYVNGRMVGEDSDIGTFPTVTKSPRIGGWLSSGLFKMSGIINEPRFYDYALTEAEVRADMYTPVDEMATASKPEHYYPEPAAVDTTSTTWVDAGNTGGQDATITFGTGAWSRPVPVGGLVDCAAWALTRVGGLSAADLTFTEAFDLPDAIIGAPLPSDATLGDALDFIRGHNGWFIWDAAAGTMTFKAFPDLATATADHTIYADSSLFRQVADMTLDPAWRLGVTRDRIGLVQVDLPAGDSDRVALASKESRSATRPIVNAPTAYPDGKPLDVYQAPYVGTAAASGGLTRLVTRLGQRMYGYEITDAAWLSAVQPGEVVDLISPAADGGMIRAICTRPLYKQGSRTLVLIGIPVSS